MHIKIDKSVDVYLTSLSDKENKKTEYLLKYSKDADGVVVISAEKKGAFPSLFGKPENNIVTIFDWIVLPGATVTSSLDNTGKAKLAAVLAEKVVKHYEKRDHHFDGNKVSFRDRITKTAQAITESLNRPEQ